MMISRTQVTIFDDTVREVAEIRINTDHVVYTKKCRDGAVFVKLVTGCELYVDADL